MEVPLGVLCANLPAIRVLFGPSHARRLWQQRRVADPTTLNIWMGHDKPSDTGGSPGDHSNIVVKSEWTVELEEKRRIFGS